MMSTLLSGLLRVLERSLSQLEKEFAAMPIWPDKIRVS